MIQLSLGDIFCFERHFHHDRNEQHDCVPLPPPLPAPCAPGGTLQVSGAQHKSMVPNAALYRCSGAHRMSHKPSWADGQTDG